MIFFNSLLLYWSGHGPVRNKFGVNMSSLDLSEKKFMEWFHWTYLQIIRYSKLANTVNTYYQLIIFKITKWLPCDRFSNECSYSALYKTKFCNNNLEIEKVKKVCRLVFTSKIWEASNLNWYEIYMGQYREGNTHPLYNYEWNSKLNSLLVSTRPSFSFSPLKPILYSL